MPSSSAFHGVVKLKGHKGAALLHVPLFFFSPVISLLFYVGILLMSDEFVSVVQIHDSVMHRCLFSLGSFPHIGGYSVLIDFLMLFSSYFLIIYLIYITVYVLIPNS